MAGLFVLEWIWCGSGRAVLVAEGCGVIYFLLISSIHAIGLYYLIRVCIPGLALVETRHDCRTLYVLARPCQDCFCLVPLLGKFWEIY